MDEILADINGTITGIELVTNDTRKAVNDTYSSGIQEVEFFKYSIEVKRTQHLELGLLQNFNLSTLQKWCKLR